MNERIYASVPIDKKAALVTGKGYQYEPGIKKEFNGFESKTPLAIVKPPIDCEDLSGIRYGRLTVLGLCKKKGVINRGEWLVRCDCGIYSTRKAKGIKRGGAENSCRACHNLAYLKRNEYWRRTGKDKPMIDFL